MRLNAALFGLNLGYCSLIFLLATRVKVHDYITAPGSGIKTFNSDSITGKKSCDSLFLKKRQKSVKAAEIHL